MAHQLKRNLRETKRKLKIGRAFRARFWEPLIPQRTAANIFGMSRNGFEKLESLIFYKLKMRMTSTTTTRQ